MRGRGGREGGRRGRERGRQGGGKPQNVNAGLENKFKLKFKKEEGEEGEEGEEDNMAG